MRHSVVLALAIAGFLVWFSAVPAHARNHELRVAQAIDEILSVDPATAYESVSMQIVRNTYDTLVAHEGSELTQITPCLAVEWSVDAAARAITFQLREGVRFLSGNPVRGEDVVESWRRVVLINGAPAFLLTQLGWTPDNFDRMVVATGNRVTVRYLADVSPHFVLSLLATTPASVIDMRFLATQEKDGDRGAAFLNRRSAGSGPFSLSEFRPGEIVELLRFNGNQILPQGVERISIRHVGDPARQLAMLTAGEVDLAMDLDGKAPGLFGGQSGLRALAVPRMTLHFLAFNQKAERLRDPALWSAARKLVDYDGLAGGPLKGRVSVHQAFWPAGAAGSLTDRRFDYDPQEAVSILDEAGVRRPLVIEVDVIDGQPFRQIADSLVESFRSAGIVLQPRYASGAEVIRRYRAREHQAILLYWTPDFLDPHSNAKAFAYNADNGDDAYASTTAWRNAWMPPPEINALTMAALVERDEDRRLAMYQDLQARIRDEAPYIIMLQELKVIGSSTNVHGLTVGPVIDQVLFRDVEVY